MHLRVMTFTTLLVAAVSADSGDRVIESFEGDGFGDWSIEGTGFGDAPVSGELSGLDGPLWDYAERSLACSAHGGMEAKGVLTSAELTLPHDYLAFLIAGGDQPGKTAVQLLVDGEVKLEAVGQNSLRCRRVIWDVKPWRDRKVRLRLVDDATGPWGMIAADHFVSSSWANKPMPAPIKVGGEHGELVAAPVIPGAMVPKGASLRIVADHASHGVMSPTALALDESGALMVSETHRFRRGIEDDRNHLYWYLEDLAAQTVEDRTKLIEKWKGKFKEGYFTEFSEVVRRLSGPDAEGVYQESTVFADGFDDELDGTAAGVFAMDGVVYLACIPEIHALADKDGDGVADERAVVQDGFGVRVSLSGHDLNGFKLGPDGRIYGTVGDRGFSLTTREGAKHHFPGEGAVFRFDPDGTNFEVIHTGLRNPKELAFDEHGNLFSVDNNSDQGDEARIVYVVEGADSGWRMEHQAMHTFHREIGLEDRPLSRWMDERMWELANPDHPAFMLPPVGHLTNGPSGLAYHPGVGFLEEEKGRFLICDYKGSAAASGIWSFAMEPDGAGMRMTDARRFLWGIAATDVTYSWDGGLLVSDFVGGWKTHEDGRILKLTPEAEPPASGTATLIREGFDHRSLDELGELLAHADMRVRTRAHLAMTRHEKGLDKLGEMAADGEGLAQLHAIWGLGVIARRGSAAKPVVGVDDFVDLPGVRYQAAAWSKLVPLLGHDDAEVRAQTIKVLGESGIVGDKLNFGELLNDESPRVRMFAAIAAGRTKALGSLSYVWDLLARNDDKDPYLRHAGVYALEKMSFPRQIQALSTHPSPALRLAAVVALGRLKSELVVGFLNDPDRRIVEEAIRAVHDRRIESARPQVAALLDDQDQAGWSDMIWIRLIHSAYRLGSAKDVDRVLAVARNPEVPVRVRKDALRLLHDWNEPHPVDQSIGLHDPLPKRDPAVAKGVLQPQVVAMMKLDKALLGRAIGVILEHGLDTSAIDTSKLESSIRDESLPGDARASLLEIHASRNTEGLEGLLVELSGMKNDALALAAVKRLVKRQSDQAVDAIRRALGSDSAFRQQEGWKIAGRLESPAVDDLIRKGMESLVENLGRTPAAIELLEVAGSREDAGIKALLENYRKLVDDSSDPLAKHFPSLKGGSVAEGRKLFRSHPGGQCMRCHVADGGAKEGMAGPSLAGVAGRGDRRFLLESLVAPGAEVATGFGIVSVTLKDGTTIGGTLVAQNDTELRVNVAGDQQTISRDRIESMTEPVSAMPPMEHLLSPEELRDLVAWLSSLKKP